MSMCGMCGMMIAICYGTVIDERTFEKTMVCEECWKLDGKEW